MRSSLPAPPSASPSSSSIKDGKPSGPAHGALVGHESRLSVVGVGDSDGDTAQPWAVAKGGRRRQAMRGGGEGGREGRRGSRGGDGGGGGKGDYGRRRPVENQSYCLEYRKLHARVAYELDNDADLGHSHWHGGRTSRT
ncbi:hypothetical protein C4D60_Mb09t15320 [Musa balbisiana]|uniref:Uncharacterized protein n=1 Tax=Musa balbisiana TaxID=52838 RepID=A0A4S8IGQ6_MUSBA|nr:hypothetical protein C4D60_Mb09t15320 [Musa balbisiana]